MRLGSLLSIAGSVEDAEASVKRSDTAAAITITPERLAELSSVNRPLDNSALSLYQTGCEWYYFAKMVRHLQPASRSTALEFGDIIHFGLEAYYVTENIEVAIALMLEKYTDWTPEGIDDHRTLKFAEAKMRGWFKTHGPVGGVFDTTLGADAGNPLIEMVATIQLPVASELLGSDVFYTVKIDRAFLGNGLYYAEDHKTTSALGPKFFNEWEMSSQMMGYTRALELLIGERVSGVRINAISTAKTVPRYERQLITFTPARLIEWEQVTARWIERLRGSYAKHDPSDSEGSSWLRNFAACSRKYGMCEFHSVCSSEGRIRERVIEQDFAVKPWDPAAEK